MPISPTPQAILPDPSPTTTAAPSKQIRNGGGERKQGGMVTVSRDLAEAPMVTALRGGVRVHRHVAGRSPASFQRGRLGLGS